MKIGILIDSSATNDASVFENTNVRLIPLHITLDDVKDVLDTEENIDKENIYKLVQEGKNVKTSQASPGELELVYDEMLKEYEHILHIPITQNLSSMMQTSFMVASDKKYEGKITIFKNVDLAANLLKVMALEIDRKMKTGEVETVEQAIEIIEAFRKASFLGIIPGDLRKLARGGRGTKAISSVLNILKTKVMIRWQADPKKVAVSRTVSGIVDKVEEVIKEEFSDGYELIFVATPLTNEKTKNNSKNELKERNIEFIEEIIPSIYTMHAGTETFGFIIYKK